MPVLERILIYPIKSLDGVGTKSAKLVEGGALQFDRKFALVDENGLFVSAKRFPLIHRLRAEFDLEACTVTLTAPHQSPCTFDLCGSLGHLEDFFSSYFGFRVRLVQNSAGGFPDDTDCPGPTIAARTTFEHLTKWFPDLCVEELIRRFRANLILGEAEAFWEDRLVGSEGEGVRFRIGEVIYEGWKPCARCAVPTRNTLTGESDARFQQIFSERRQKELPIWAEPSRFTHFYRLGVNTRAAAQEIGKTLHVGDPVALL
ncbi:MAG: MOSC N-terminal beta barrel domain-containing protein [Chloroherpetonaceae bacterium]|nr:MOSC N-terminal beta barrel domain-containing protein [Chloroherpetonaceae bacterium]MDW8020397.1 MOSC N-terminal beta barrel domain-containing protein [Chloroherpetonaceae bacterium]